MMRRPWQIWTLFLLCLAMVLPAMVWLTRKTLELDRAETLARQQAAMEEAVGSALWQIDSELTRLLAPEIARPPFTYRPFYSVASGKGGARQLPSPLLLQPSPFVRLHFELRPDGQWRSPQCPDQDLYPRAVAHGVPSGNIEFSRGRLKDLSGLTDYKELVAEVPERNLSQAVAMTWANPALLPISQPDQVVKNVLDYENVQQQLANIQNAPAQFPQQAESQPSSDFSQQVQSRRSNELQSRNYALQAAAQQAIRDQRANLELVPELAAPGELIAEGISQPVWVKNQLLLVRRVESKGEILIQGCWLDWPRIRSKLLETISPILNDADLVPVRDMREVRLTRVLAALPVQLVVRQPTVTLNPFSPIRVSLIVAWLFLGLATVAMAVLLQGVVTLSERRAAFVSAVTHELRTPLTTFRMYAEMLLEGMIPDAEQRRSYLETLKVEADRLAHLVENVLQYARLERGSHKRRRDPIEVASLIDRVHHRLCERASQAGMRVEIEADDSVVGLLIRTDPGAVEQILFNLVDNACKYATGSPDPRIHIRLEANDRKLTVQVRDHGPGIAAGDRRRLFRPFSKSAADAANSAPGVGLGLALCRRLAVDLGGRLEVECHPGSGAVFTLTLPRE